MTYVQPQHLLRPSSSYVPAPSVAAREESIHASRAKDGSIHTPSSTMKAAAAKDGSIHTPSSTMNAAAVPSVATVSPKLQRLQVRCIAAGGEEEVLIVPVGTSSWTIADLLTGIKDRVQYVPLDDLQELQLDDANGGRFHPSDLLTAVVKDSDLLRCAPAVRHRSTQPGVVSSSNGRVDNHHNSQAINNNDELRAGYTRVFGNDGETKEEDTDGSSTPPAQGNHLWEATRDERSRSPIRTVPPVSTSLGGPAAVEGREGKWPPLLRAAYEGDVETARTLLRERADINCTMPGAGQKTPIYYAIRFENPELVRLLLEHPDIDVNRQMRLGRSGSWTTPLEAAREAGVGSGVHQAFVDCGLLEAPAPNQTRRTSPYAGVSVASRRAAYGKGSR
mmetsp:Transcript_73005/g.144702  ORF Transcript_73005/g.144702 Transcript_73005/m.144702 type:complete len:391 (-) Transcript_73005:122-1294(-)